MTYVYVMTHVRIYVTDFMWPLWKMDAPDLLQHKKPGTVLSPLKFSCPCRMYTPWRLSDITELCRGLFNQCYDIKHAYLTVIDIKKCMSVLAIAICM